MNKRRQAARARAVIRLANCIHRAWPAAIPGGWMAWKAMTRPVVRGGTVPVVLEDGQLMRCSLTHARYHVADDYEPFSRAVFGRGASLACQAIVDVGANAGFFSLTAAQAAPTAVVHAFEPHPEWARIVASNLAANHHANAQVHPVALGNESGGRARLHYAAAAGSHGFYSEADDGGGVDVPVARACEVLPAAPDMVKIDVEGHEEMVLRGMTPWLAGDHDMLVLVEVIPSLLERAGSSRQAVLEQLEPGHFDLFVVDDAKRRLVPLAAAGDDWPGRNLLALRGRFKQLAATEPAAAATH